MKIYPAKIIFRMKKIRVFKHSFQIDFFFTVGTRLLLSNNAPTTDTKLVKSVECCC